MNTSDNTSALRNLSALVDFSSLINSSLDLNFALNNLLLTCFGKFHTTRGIILLLDENNNLVPAASKGLSKSALSGFPICKYDGYSENPKYELFCTNNKLFVRCEINSGSGFRGVLLIGEKIDGNPFSQEDHEFLHTLVNIGATAIENSLVIEKIKKVNRELDSKVNQLSSLFDLSKEFSGILDEKNVSRVLVFSLLGQLLVSKYAVVTIRENRPYVLESNFSEKMLLEEINKCKSCELTKPVGKKEIHKKYPGFESMGVELMVPMQIKNESKGIIFLGKRNTLQEYSKSDIEYVYSVASTAVISIENARLFQEAVEKQKMEKDLEIARNIQRNLLPKKLPDLKNFDICGYNVTAKQVGGDYYDVVKLDEARTLIAIGDVSGKGVQAALLMANVQAFLKSIWKQNIELDEASNLINDLVSENTTGGSFITFFWGILNDDTKEITYVNAGHNPPLLVRNGEIRKLKLGGMILGVVETMAPYKSETVRLQTGDALITFTDGVTEAMNNEDREYSEERLEKLAVEIAGNSAQNIVDNITADLAAHTNGALQSDDITVLIVKVN